MCRCESHMVITSVHFCVCNRALVCLFGFKSAAEVTMTLSAASKAVEKQATTITLWYSHLKVKDGTKAARVVLSRAAGKFSPIQLSWLLCRAAHHTCQLVASSFRWGLAPASGFHLSLFKCVFQCIKHQPLLPVLVTSDLVKYPPWGYFDLTVAGKLRD